MRRFLYLLAFLSVALSACSSSPMTPDDDKEYVEDSGGKEPEVLGYDIYLLIGQSNAAGRADLVTGDEKPIEGVKIVRSIPYAPCMVVDACQPLNQYSTVRRRASLQGYNFAGPFAAKLHKETGRPILLIVNARAATSLDSWLPTAERLIYSQESADEPDMWGKAVPQLYSEAVRITKQVISQENIKGELKGILWHQGCSNSSASQAPQYCDKLKTVVDGLREEFENPGLSFVAGQICPEYKNASYFNPEIVKIGQVIENSYCATTEGLSSIGDNTHFNRESLIILGERYADIILRCVYKILP